MSSDADKRQGRSDSGASGGALPARNRRRLDGELGRFEPVSDALVLAALERAERHREREREGDRRALGVRSRVVDYAPAASAARRAHCRRVARAVTAPRRRGWELADAGRRHLEQIRLAGEARELAEAPQHRAWRHARAASGERIDGFRAQARQALEDAAILLDAEDAHSDAWFAVAERLQAACWRVGSATHCLREWREPDDARPDVDDRCDTGDDTLDSEEVGRVRYRRIGRRGVWR